MPLKIQLYLEYKIVNNHSQKMAQKLACFDISAGKNAKISAMMTLAHSGIVILGAILAVAAGTQYNSINQLAVEQTGPFAIIPIITLLLAIFGCGLSPNIIAYYALNKKSMNCIWIWFICYLVIAIFVTMGLVGTIVRAGSTYNLFCDVEGGTCAEQFKYQTTCNHTASSPFGRGAPPVNVKVSKAYCDSKGMDYQGAWYGEIFSHVVSAFVFLLSNVVTFYICWYKKNEFQGPTGAATQGTATIVTTTATATIVMAPVVQPVIVQAVIKQ